MHVPQGDLVHAGAPTLPCRLTMPSRPLFGKKIIVLLLIAAALLGGAFLRSFYAPATAILPVELFEEEEPQSQEASEPESEPLNPVDVMPIGEDGEPQRTFVPGEVLVTVRSAAVSAAALAEQFSTYDVLAATALSNQKDSPLSRIVKLSAPGLDTPRTLELVEAVKQTGLEAEVNRIYVTSDLPNDTYMQSSGAWGQDFKDLWGLYRIDAPRAWGSAQGEGVTVAVIDTGVDLDHQDIAQNIWTNTEEIPDNGKDDDKNGFMDDVNGWNFVDRSPAMIDDVGHGTHVAGTIAATGNNALGIVGVAPRAKIMPLRGLGEGGGSLADLLQAIYYAADNGAQVINASWGAGFPGTASRILTDAVEYAYRHGVTFVAAAGNSADNVGTPEYGYEPASLPRVIAVAASDSDDRSAFFSNYGEKIDVAAPGGGDRDPEDAYKPYYSILSLLSSFASPDLSQEGKPVIGGAYVRLAGTSMASPHVAGVAALVKSLHPSFGPDQVRSVLRESSDDVGKPGRDSRTGYGRVNAARAVGFPPMLVEILSPRNAALSVGQGLTVAAIVEVAALSSWKLEYGPGKSPATWRTIATGSQPIHNAALATWDLSSVTTGDYTLRLTATDRAGKSIADQTTLRLSIDPTIRAGWPKWEESHSMGAVTVADVFGKGGKQILVAVGDHISIYDANGSALLGWPQTIPAGRTVTAAPSVGDLDGDRVPDVTACDIQGTCYAWNNAGQMLPGWPSESVFSVTDYITSLAEDGCTSIADMDGDGQNEVVVSGNSNVAILSNRGVVLHSWQREWWLNTNCQIAIGDLNGDGRPEIAASSNHILTALDGNAKFLWQKIGDRMQELSHPVIADIDGDGKHEILVNDLFRGVVAYRGSDGSAVREFRSDNLNKLDHTIAPPAIGDIDGDGKPEVVMTFHIDNNRTRMSSTTIYVWRADGSVPSGWPVQVSIPFPTKPPYGTNSFRFTMASLTDVDGDGRADVVVAGNPDANGNKIRAYRSDGKEIPSIARKAGFDPDAGKEWAPPIATALSSNGGPASLVWLDWDGTLYVWDTSSPAPKAAPWPMLGQNPQHTNVSVPSAPVASCQLLDQSFFVKQQYQDLLLRTGGDGEVAGWVTRMKAGMTRKAMITAVLQSSEFQNFHVYVARGYLLLGRGADLGGLRAWSKAFAGGMSRDTFLQALIGSPEFTQKYGALDNSGFVRLLFKNILGRQPEPAALNYFAGRLNLPPNHSQRLTRQGVARLILESSESNARNSSNTLVQSLYLHLLQRAGAPFEVATWAEQLKRGASLENIVSGFINAAEYQKRFSCQNTPL